MENQETMILEEDLVTSKNTNERYLRGKLLNKRREGAICFNLESNSEFDKILKEID